jgi:hypothetical protein
METSTVRCVRCHNVLSFETSESAPSKGYFTAKTLKSDYKDDELVYDATYWCATKYGTLTGHIPDNIPFYQVCIEDHHKTDIPNTEYIRLLIEQNLHLNKIHTDDFVQTYDFCVNELIKIFNLEKRLYNQSKLIYDETDWSFTTSYPGYCRIVLMSKMPILSAFRNNVIKNPPTASEVLMTDLKNIRDRFGKLAEEYLNLMRSYEETAKKLEDLPKG